MSDIDFDELDKAVNSLVGDNSDEGELSQKIDLIPPETDGSDDKKGASLLPKRRTGRFMDVVHPSSDMGSEDKKFAPPHSTKTIAPIRGLHGDVIQKEAAEGTPSALKNDWPDPVDAAEDSSKQHESSEKENDAPQEVEKLSTDMPDPLEHLASKETEDNLENQGETVEEKSEEKQDEKETSQDKESPEVKTEAESGPEHEEQTPAATASSPFLEGTKVEKRPLGAFNESGADQKQEETKQTEKAEQQPAEESTSEPTDNLNTEEINRGADVSPTAPLPPELGKELVAIESGGTLEPPDKSDKPATPEGESDKDAETADSSKETGEPEDISEKTQDTKDNQPSETKEPEKQETTETQVKPLLTSSALGSIPQQYKKALAQSEHQPAHPLFNVEHYKSEAAAKKQKPSSVAHLFQWIFIVIGLLLLGVVLGAGVFILINNS